jgi:hypothetical protein
MWQSQRRYGQKNLRYQNGGGKWITLLALLGMMLVACSGPQTPSSVPSRVTPNDSQDRSTSPDVSVPRGDMLSRGSQVKVVQAPPVARTSLRLMFMFQVPGQEPNQVVETALISKFQDYGYSVLDAEIVAQTLRRNADLLQLYDIEAAKRLGGRLGADIVISGVSKTRVLDKTYEVLGGKKVTISQADVSAKAVLVSSGKIL